VLTEFSQFQLGDANRTLIQKYDLKKRPYLGTTSMDAELSLIMSNMGLVGLRSSLRPLLLFQLTECFSRFDFLCYRSYRVPSCMIPLSEPEVFC
jgi:hypothetical protein